MSAELFPANPLWPSSDDGISFAKSSVPPPGQTENYHAACEAAVLCGEASVIVSGKRQGDHGSKERSFASIANLWTAYVFGGRPDPQANISEIDVCYMMQLMKMVRSQHGNPAMRDHYVDNIGYAAIAGELAL